MNKMSMQGEMMMDGMADDTGMDRGDAADELMHAIMGEVGLS